MSNEASSRLRTDLRLSTANTCDHGPRTPFPPGVRHRGARSPDDQPFGADLPLPRCLRQLVQPHRRSRRPDPIVGRWRRQRYWEAGLGPAPWAAQHAVEDLPAETLNFLLASRYCETDRLSEVAWNLFGQAPMGWGRVQAICDFVHRHIVFGYEYAGATKTAWDVFNEAKGVCRDYAHL